VRAAPGPGVGGRAGCCVHRSLDTTGTLERQM